MTAEEIGTTVLDALTRIAPEIDPASIEPGANFRDELDLDSMDFLNFVLAVHDRLKIEIPEADYPRLSTLESAVAYLPAGGSTHRQYRHARNGTRRCTRVLCRESDGVRCVAGNSH